MFLGSNDIFKQPIMVKRNSGPYRAFEFITKLIIAGAAISAVVVGPIAYVKAGRAQNDANQAQSDATQAQDTANSSGCSGCTSGIVNYSGISFNNSFNDNITTTFNVTNVPITAAYQYLFVSNVTQTNGDPIGTEPVTVFFERIGNIIIASTKGFSASDADGNTDTLLTADSVPDVFIPRRMANNRQTGSPYAQVYVISNGSLIDGYWQIQPNGKVSFDVGLPSGFFTNTIVIQPTFIAYSYYSDLPAV